MAAKKKEWIVTTSGDRPVKDVAKDLFRNDRPFIFKTTYRCGFLGIRCATTPG